MTKIHAGYKITEHEGIKILELRGDCCWVWSINIEGVEYSNPLYITDLDITLYTELT